MLFFVNVNKMTFNTTENTALRVANLFTIRNVSFSIKSLLRERKSNFTSTL